MARLTCLRRDAVLVVGESREQRLVGENVDAPGQALRGFEYLAHCAGENTFGPR